MREKLNIRRSRLETLETRKLLAALEFETYPIPDISVAADAIIRTDTAVADLLIAEENLLHLYDFQADRAALKKSFVFEEPITDVERGLNGTQLVATQHRVFRIDAALERFELVMVEDEIVDVAEAFEALVHLEFLYISTGDTIVRYSVTNDGQSVNGERLEAEGDIIELFPPPEGVAIKAFYAVREDTNITVRSTNGFGFEEQGVVTRVSLADEIELTAVGDYVSQVTDDLVVGTDRGEVALVTGSVEDSRYLRVEETVVLKSGHDGSGSRFSMVAADLNKDSLFDLVVVESIDASATEPGTAIVTWQENTGRGSFIEYPLLTTNDPDTRAFIVESDEDGEAKLLVAANGRLEVFDFVFGAASEISFSVTPLVGRMDFLPHVARVADIDGDGDRDVIAGGEGDASLVWYPHLRNGQFGAPRVILESEQRVVQLTLKDVDQDGRLDLYVQLESSIGRDVSFQLLRQDEAQSFTSELISSYARGFRGTVPTFAEDIDGDGDIDLFTHNSWVENIENRFEVSHALFDDEAPRAIAVDDFDGDGDFDVAAFITPPGTRRDLYYFVNQGGQFEARTIFEGIRGFSQVDTLAFANVDDDSELELVISDYYYDSKNGVISSEATELGLGFSPRPELADAVVIAVQDVDDDGIDELFSSRHSLGVARLHGEPAETILDTIPGSQLQPTMTSIEINDLNEDGIPDLLVASPTSYGLTWYAGEQSDGTITWSSRRELRQQPFVGSDSPKWVDLNNDSQLDILSQNDVGQFGWYQNVDGQFGTVGSLIAQAGFDELIPWDMDGDGDQDLFTFTRNFQGPPNLSWLENTTGDGNFSAPQTLNVEGDVFEFDRIRSYDVADLDGDGDADLTLGPFHGSTVTWLENQGANQPIYAHTLHELPHFDLAATSFVRIVDIDQDGDQDVVASAYYVYDESTSYDIVLLENVDGHAPFQPTQLDAASWYAEYAVPMYLIATDVVDIDEDERPEIVVLANFGAFKFELEGDAWVKQRLTGPADLQAVIDVDFDGDLDFLGKECWFENMGDGNFEKRRADSWEQSAIVQVADFDGDGDQDALLHDGWLTPVSAVLENKAVSSGDDRFDINQDSRVDGLDLDVLCAALAQRELRSRYDLNNDSIVDRRDVLPLLDRLRSVFADVNFDGRFDTSDLTQIFAAGLYEQGDSDEATWSTGDLNCDGRVDSSDLVTALQVGTYLN